MVKSSEQSNRFEKYPKTVLLCVFVVFFLLLELGARVVDRMTSPIIRFDQKGDQIYQKQRWTNMDYVPNNTFARFPDPLDSFEAVANHINSIGIRGPEIAKKNRSRILNIGDSFVQADLIEWEKTFSELLNQSFDNKAEFIAHGIGGWSPTPEFSWIYNKGMKLGPDEVNIFLCLNDFYRSGASIKVDQTARVEAIYKDGIPVEYTMERNWIPPEQRSATLSLVVWINENVFFLRPVYRVYHSLKIKLLATLKGSPSTQGNEIILLAQDHSKWPVSLANNVDDTINVVLELNRFLKKHHVKLNVAMIPFPFAWQDECRYGKAGLDFGQFFTISQDGFESYLQVRLKENGIPYIDLRSGFNRAKRQNPDVLLYYPQDCHWNENGHRVVFEVLKSFYNVAKGGFFTK